MSEFLLNSEPRQMIVNENDEIIGSKYRSEISPDDIYRVSSLWVVKLDEGGHRALIAQRKFTKKNDPGKWGPSVAGTVDEDETYEMNIMKEAGEEIGLFGAELVPMDEKSSFHDGEQKYFLKEFVVSGNWKLSDFTPQESEVEKLEFPLVEDLLDDIRNNPDKYLAGFDESVQKLKDYLDQKNDFKDLGAI